MTGIGVKVTVTGAASSWQWSIDGGLTSLDEWSSMLNGDDQREIQKLNRTRPCMPRLMFRLLMKWLVFKFRI